MRISDCGLKRKKALLLKSAFRNPHSAIMNSIRKNHQMEISGNIITPTRRRTVAFSIFVCTLVFVICSAVSGQQKTSSRSANPPSVKAIPDEVMLKIVRAEDERRWDNDLGALLFD